jgi:hypothetical protein
MEEKALHVDESSLKLFSKYVNLNWTEENILAKAELIRKKGIELVPFLIRNFGRSESERRSDSSLLKVIRILKELKKTKKECNASFFGK